MGEAGIAQLGHRDYVGGLWDEMGQLQLEFLISQGLEPRHRLLDIACGSLRLGVKAIAYLDSGHYIGVEKEAQLIELGLQHELDPELRQRKRPLLLVDADFRFERIGQPIDRAMAQSLFSHLPASEIQRCLGSLRPCLQPDGVLYATFFESERAVRNPRAPHDHYHFRYTRAEMLALGRQQGYVARYIGDWGHPRGQVMVEYRPC